MSALANENSATPGPGDAVNALATSSVEESRTRIEKAAEFFQSKGWPTVFIRNILIGPDGKKEVAGAEKWETATADMPVRRGWSQTAKAIGVRTGEISGVVFVDLDGTVPRWDALLAEHGEPDTWKVSTRTGGTHYGFKWDDRMARFAKADVALAAHHDDQGKKLGAVDLRASGRIVFAPPTVCSDGSSYDLINSTDPIPMPDWLFDALVAWQDEKLAAREARKAAPSNITPATINETDGRLRLALGEIQAATDGQKHDVLNRSSFTIGGLVGGGVLTFDRAVELIEEACHANGAYPFDNAQIATMHRALEDGTNSPIEPEPSFDGLFGHLPYRSPTGLAETENPAVQVRRYMELDHGKYAHAFFKKDKEDGSSTFRQVHAAAAMHFPGRIVYDERGVAWTYSDGVYTKDDRVITRRLTWLLGDLYSRTIRGLVEDQVRSTAATISLATPPPNGYMNFTNGLLEWRTGVLHSHSEDVVLTTQFPYDWDPSALCPRFDHWLSVMLEPDQIALAWKILGYMMLSGNPLQVAIMLYGKGSNGKSTFLNVIGRLLGDRNLSAVPLKDFNERFQTGPMIGKIANIVGDIDSSFQVSTAALKQATGGDRVQLEDKGKNPILAYLWATCVFSANKIPGTSDRSEGYAERWIPIHFKRKAKDHRIENFSEEQLWAEVQGIAVKAVTALQGVPIASGFDRAQAFDLTSASAIEAVKEFQEASDVYLSWVKNHTRPSEGLAARPKDAWMEFKLQTGARRTGTNCPPELRDALAAEYGEPKTVRGTNPWNLLYPTHKGWNIEIFNDPEDVATREEEAA